jgi:hypothetical protein
MASREEEVLAFLSEWRGKNEVCEKFNFSPQTWYHLKRWLLKGRFVESMKVPGSGFRNRADCVYRVLK